MVGGTAPDTSGFEVRASAESVMSEISAALAGVDWSQLDALATELLEVQRVFFTGAGRSLLSASSVSMRLMHLGLSSFVVGETATPAIAAGDLLIAVSASGSGSAVTHAHVAREVGARTALVTANAGSPLVAEVDTLVVLPARSIDPPGVQYGGSLFEQCVLVVGDALCASLRTHRRLEFADLDRRHANLA